MSSTDKALQVITGFYKRKGFYPSVDDIAKKMEIHRSMAHKHVVKLEEDGHIKRNKRGRIIFIHSPQSNEQGNPD